MNDGGQDAQVVEFDANVTPDVGAADTGADTGPEPMDSQVPPTERCGNSSVEGEEECDDGNDSEEDFCLNSCEFACGDGVQNEVEACDTGIDEGEEGACPTACDDMNACTIDTLAGAGCETACVHSDVTVCASDDGCCPMGCDSLNDNDCDPVCGNMLIEEGELCEDGSAAACATACTDNNRCTTDALEGNAADCNVACSYTAITECDAVSDGCCPGECEVDPDCSTTCGNQSLEANETCDDSTNFACPTSCDDGNACTVDELVGDADLCNAECAVTPITVCQINGDGCCPPACNANNDGDCTPVCGNRVIESGEECDDGNQTDGDGCEACVVVIEPSAFRITDLDLRDPHVFIDFLLCLDATEAVLGMSGINQLIEEQITMDDDNDGFYDTSFIGIFRPLDQTDGMPSMAAIELTDGECEVDGACTITSEMMSLARSTYTNMSSGTCLSRDVDGMSVVRPYSPPVTEPTGPCFVSGEETIMLVLSDIPITLYDAQVSAQYVGDPTDGLMNGLIRGFITEEDAGNTILPDSIDVVGGMSLESLLAGGTGNCSTTSDMDTHPQRGMGWWLFLNFAAESVELVEQMVDP